MRRLAALLLVVSGLGLVAAPVDAAGAADRPRLSVSRTDVGSGTPVVLRGRVAAARTRDVIQRRTPSAWRSVVATRSTARGLVRFRVVPPDGDQRYRLRVPGQRGRGGRSPVASVRVRWQPSLTLTSTTHATAPGGVVTTAVSGSSSGLAGVGLLREARSAGGTWVVTTTSPDGTRTTTSRATLTAPTPGRLMVVAHAAGRSFSDWITLRATGSTFPPGTGFALAHGAPDASLYRGLGPAGDPFPFDYNQVRYDRLLFVYAGPTATGTLDLEIDVHDW